MVECIDKILHEAGKYLLDMLRLKTRSDPKYAVLTGIMHSGRRAYEPHQTAVDMLTQLSPEDLANKELVEKALKLMVPVLVSESVYGLPEDRLKLMGREEEFAEFISEIFRDCYNPICGPNPQECLCKEYDSEGNCISPKLDKLISCIRSKRVVGKKQIYTVGPKGEDMIRLYAGDRKNVPIDTHAMRYICENAMDEPMKSWCEKRYFKRVGGPRNRREYERLKHEFWKLAESCSKPIDEYQVTVWLKNMCEYRKEHGFPTDVRLMAGFHVDCEELLE